MIDPQIGNLDPNSYEYYVKFSPNPYIMEEEEFNKIKLHENDILNRISKVFSNAFEAVFPERYHTFPTWLKISFMIGVSEIEEYSKNAIKMTKGACATAWVFITQNKI